MKDEQLVRQFQQGDQSAFETLVRRYQDKVLNTCYRFLGNPDDARDAAQEIFIKVYTNLKKFKPHARFSTWLYRVAVNHALNALRSRKRRRGILLFSALPLQESLIRIPDNTLQPDQNYAESEQHDLVMRAIEQLGERQRSLVILHQFEGLAYKEIAEVMGMSKSAVESQLCRAKKKLLLILKPVIEGRKSL